MCLDTPGNSVWASSWRTTISANGSGNYGTWSGYSALCRAARSLTR
jgi:hypothetical protein